MQEGLRQIILLNVWQSRLLVEADQETLSQVGVRIIRTGHIKGRVELMSMRIGKVVKVVMIARVEEMRM
jgi:hypothetical protein